MAKDGGFKEKFTSLLGLDEPLEDDMYLEEDEQEEEYYPDEDVSNHENRVNPTRSTSPKTTQSPDPDVLVLYPTEFNEAPGIVNKLKEDKTVLVNLKQTEFEEGRKIFDFLSGAVYALEGSLNRVAESVFILAPRMIKVENETKKPVEEENKVQDEIITWDEPQR